MLTTAIETVALLLIAAGVVVEASSLVGWGPALIVGGVLLFVISWLLVRLGGKS